MHTSLALILQKIISEYILHDGGVGGGELEPAGGRKLWSIRGGLPKSYSQKSTTRPARREHELKIDAAGFSSETLYGEYRVRSPSSHLVLPV